MKKKKVLVCPLDWGLGHATRCIPIIRELILLDLEVIVAADNRPLELLKQEFPELKTILFPGTTVRYPASGNMLFSMALQFPKILSGIWKEHRFLDNLIRQENIDYLISDNRYGLWSKKIPCIFITHQLMVKCPKGLKLLEPLLHRLILFFVKKYTCCWVPDFPGENNLSGDLSHQYPLTKNTRFIGPLSRLENALEKNKEIDILAIISGPEPQKTFFENKIIDQFLQLPLRTMIISGTPETRSKKDLSENVEMLPHVNSTELQALIENSKLVICRSGYSSIMDIYASGKKVFFVPTPGQTEQEYLAGKFLLEKIAFSQNQEDFSIAYAIKVSENYSGFIDRHKFSKSTLKEAISLSFQN